jgi:excisionase family DNA binding protein
MDTQEREAFSPDEFAQRYGIGRGTVFSEIKAGRLVARKIGKRTLISIADGRQWLESLPRARDIAA